MCFARLWFKFGLGLGFRLKLGLASGTVVIVTVVDTLYFGIADMAIYENVARALAPLLRTTGTVVERMGLALEGATAYKEKRKR